MFSGDNKTIVDLKKKEKFLLEFFSTCWMKHVLRRVIPFYIGL